MMSGGREGGGIKKCCLGLLQTALLSAEGKNLKKDQLNELCATFFHHIEDLELRLQKSKAPPAPVSNEDYELRAELKELNDAVLVDENGINAMEDKQTGSLTQAYWASGDKRAIPWDVINKFAEDDSVETSSKEDDVKGAVNATSSAVSATSVKEDDVEGATKANVTSSKAKSAKLAKLVKMAKSTDLGCLLLFVPLLQEAKAKQRKVCPLKLRGRSARPITVAANTPRSASWPTTARGRSPRPCARCGTCRFCSRASPRETSKGGGAAPSLPPAARGTTAAMPGRPSRTSSSSSSMRSTVPRSSRQGSGQQR
jgi:hypothetical protein